MAAAILEGADTIGVGDAKDSPAECHTSKDIIEVASANGAATDGTSSSTRTPDETKADCDGSFVDDVDPIANYQAEESCLDVSSGGASSSTAEVSNDELWREDVGNPRRADKWKRLLLGGINLQAKNPQEYYDNLCQTTSPYDSAIRRDVNRTLPQEELFQEKNGKGQQALFRLLRALALRLWDVGYCQSLNFVVATLIGVFPDDESAVFDCALALLLRHSLVDMFRPKFPKLGVIIWQFDRIVEGFLPKVHASLQKHGVNAEYYAIQWFLTLFASDLDQVTVRRIWDRFLVAGWQVVVQVALALLYTIQDTLPTFDVCYALTFLRKFARTTSYDTEELLRLASTFEVSHQMLSSLEASYDWEGDVQLLVVKDLNGGQVHWAVQSVPKKTPTKPPSEDCDGGEETPMPIPQAFIRSSGSASKAGGAGLSPREPVSPGRGSDGSVEPFLIHDLDTGKTSVMQSEWTQYMQMQEKKAKAKAQAAPLMGRARSSSESAEVGFGGQSSSAAVRPAAPSTTAAAGANSPPVDGRVSADSALSSRTKVGGTVASAGYSSEGGRRISDKDAARARRPEELSRSRKDAAGGASNNSAANGVGGGSFWMQSVQRQAARRLSQV